MTQSAVTAGSAANNLRHLPPNLCHAAMKVAREMLISFSAAGAARGSDFGVNVRHGKTGYAAGSGGLLKGRLRSQRADAARERAGGLHGSRQNAPASIPKWSEYAAPTAGS
jgi:hypothetical protein